MTTSAPHVGRPLTLADRDSITAGVAQGAFRPAETAFANLWLFRDRHRYHLHDDPLPHVSGVTYDGASHAMPLVPLTVDCAMALLGTGVDILYPLGSEAGAIAGTGRFILDQRAADADYWYAAAAMATLDGSRARRQQAAAFVQAQRPVAVCFDAGTMSDARTVLDGWLADVGRAASQTDYAECAAAITDAARLDLEGWVVRTGVGEPVAFLLASRSDDAGIVHFAKGRRAHSGAYPWMFAHHAASVGVRWLNFEQDLGNPGLAQSKRAYAPIRLQPKWRLRLKI